MFPFDDVIMLRGAISGHNIFWCKVLSISFSNALPITWYWFYYVHFEMWNLCWRTIIAENMSITKELIYKYYQLNVLHVCRPTLQHIIWYGWDTSMHISCNIQYNIQISINHSQCLRLYMINTFGRIMEEIVGNILVFILKSIRSAVTWAPSQYKDRLIYVWWFPC